jgi:hypothetical protein
MYVPTTTAAQTGVLSLGRDFSTNAVNNWTSNNLSLTEGTGNDSLVDSPTYYGTLSTTPSEDTYQISRSLRLKGTNTTLSRAVTVEGNRKTWTWSAWVKRSALGTVQQLFCRNDSAGASNYTFLYFLDDNSIQFLDSTAGSTATTSFLTTKAKFTDTTNWYHIVLAVDTLQVIDTHRVKLYVNGTLMTSFTSVSWPGRNNQTQIGTVNTHYIGSNRKNSQFFSGYLAEVNHIDGLALGADSFGVREAGTYLWKPKAYTGTYGTNGFSLKFSDSSTKAALGTDSSGLNNTYDVEGSDFSVATGALTAVNNDSFIDVPTYYGTDNGAGGEARGSYATMDPAYPGSVLSYGNLRSTAGAAISTLSMTSGKYYFEATPTTSTVADTNTYYIGVTGSAFVSYALSGNKFNGTAWVAFGSAYTTGDVIGLAVDVSGGVVNFYKNDVLQGTQAITANGSYTVVSNISTLNTGSTFDFNFGQRAFRYAAPAGFKALRDYNKPPVQTGGELRGNYATLNPLFGNTGGTITDGNLTLTHTGGGNGKNALGVSSVAVSSGKWYGEFTNTAATTSDRIGIISSANNSIVTSGNPYFSQYSDGYSAYVGGGTYKENNNTASTITNFGASAPAAGDVYMVALDMDKNKVWFGRNGSWANNGNPNTGLGETFSILSGRSYYFACNTYLGDQLVANFGQRAWAFGAPLGFSPLRDYNKLPVPTGGEVRGNYATLNPLVPADSVGQQGASALSNGNLSVKGYNSSFNFWATATLSTPISGKWYFEVTSINQTDFQSVGILDASGKLQPFNSSFFRCYLQSGNKNTGVGTGGSVSYGNSWTTNDIIGVAIDADNGALYFSKNGTWQNSGVPTSGASKTGAAYTDIGSRSLFPAVFCGSAVTNEVALNFGQRPWAYDAPFGFKPLCTTLLPQPTIQKSSTAMDVVTYTGNATGQTISSLGFSPNLVWLKSRSNATYNYLFDTVRGINTFLFSNTTTQDTTATSLTSFNSNGFTLGADPAPDTSTGFNAGGSTQIAWAWNAGSSSVSNTSGSITSTVRANPQAGFSIVGYTGNGTTGSVGHGLGLKPSFIIVKNRSVAIGNNWGVYHSSLTASQYIYLNLTNPASASGASTAWGNNSSTIEPTSSVFTVGNSTAWNGGENLMIAYCFSEVEGYSKFGSYVGNGLADGPFVYCGFRPRWILFKRTDVGSHWVIYDTARNTTNPLDLELAPNNPNLDNGTVSSESFDLLSNGFKIRCVISGEFNVSNAAYIFAAFAESPFKYARAR